MRNRFSILDAIRGLAAGCVVLFHAGREGGLAPNGDLAPDLFFVLSGFVLAFAYSVRLQAGLTTGKFMLIRLIRLAPLYLLGISIASLALLMGLIGNISSRDILLNSLFIPSLSVSSAMYRLDPPAWSLFYELLINAIYAILIHLLSVRVILVIISSTGFMLFVLAITRGTYLGGWNFNLGQAVIGFLRVSFSFSTGVLIFMVRDRLPNITVHPAFLYAVVIVTFIVPLLGPWEMAYQLICLFVIFPALVIIGSSSYVFHQQKRVDTWLGDISYGIYILHYPILMICINIRFGVLFDIIILVSIITLVTFVDRYYDRPMRSYLNALMRG